MNGFIADVDNRPGEMAQVTEKLAAHGVNILVYGAGTDSRYIIGWVGSDDDATRAALVELGVTYREVPLIFVTMEDKPGQSAAASRKLAEAGVNIEFWLPVDTSQQSFTVAIGVDNAEAAKKVLDEQLTTWSYS